MAEECIFCKIAKKEVPSYRIYEDNEYIAFLDIYPNIKGQSLVIPRKHLESYAFALDGKELAGIVIAAKKVSKLLEARLKVGRVHMVLEGTGVNHLHAKLYPALGTNKAFEAVIAEEKLFFEAYPGYVTTLMGPRAKDEDLKALQKQITS